MASFRRLAPGIAIAGVLALLTAGIVAFATQYLGQDAKPPKKVVQVQLFKPPPPPPPEVQPPPPEVQEEIKMPDPEPVADAPDVPDVPPSETLGLDADGVAGSDAFGLVGRKGGRDLLAGGSRHQWYAGRVKDQLLDYLSSRDEVRAKSYSVVVQIWVLSDGRLDRFRLVNSTGNPDLDKAIARAFDGLERFKDPPPADMPQPVRLRIVSRV